MGKIENSQTGAGDLSKVPGEKVQNGRKKAVRRTFQHEMTDREKWALQIVLKAKASCTQLALAIQEGKQVSPSTISRCVDVINAAGEVMFA